MSVRLKLECSFDGTGASWTTLTSWSGKDYLLQARGVDVTAGREDESGEAISPGTLSFVLDNADYRFSPGITTSPCYPYLEDPGSLLRLSVWVNGAWQALFQGVAQSWAATLDGDLTGKKSVCTVTATDTLGNLPSHTLMDAAAECFRSLPSMVACWPLRESASPAVPMFGTLALKDNAGEGWGGGGLLAMDEGTDPHPLFVGASGKLKLSNTSLNLPAPWTVWLVVLGPPSAGCTLMRLNDRANVTWSSGDGMSLVDTPTANAVTLGPSASWPQLVSVSANGSLTVINRWSADGSSMSSSIFPIGNLLSVVVNPTLSGGKSFSAGWLAITAGLWGVGNDLAAALLGSRAMPLAGPPVQWIAERAGIASISGATAGESILPQMDGRDAADVMAALVTGMGARLVDKRDGTLAWVGFGPSGTPVAVPRVTGDLAWGSSSVGWMSDQTVMFADGSTYTASRSDGPRTSGPELEAVHADPSRDRSLADWNVNSGGLGGRCSVVPVDMMGLTEAQRAALAAILPSGRITPPTLPYMPSGVVLIVEGVEHHIDAEGWTTTFKTSPDVCSRLLVWNSGDTWDGGKLWAP